MKKKFLLITGGTGGHVIPAENFANYLFNKNIECETLFAAKQQRYQEEPFFGLISPFSYYFLFVGMITLCLIVNKYLSYKVISFSNIIPWSFVQDIFIGD